MCIITKAVLNLLLVFTKEEGDAESECAPPRPSNMHSSIGDDDATEGLLLVETAKKCFQQNPSCEGDPSTIETFVHSMEGPVEDCGNARVLRPGSDKSSNKPDGGNIDLESYHSSPQKYQLMNSKENDIFQEYMEQDMGLPFLSSNINQCRFVSGGYLASGTVGIPRAEPSQCYIQEQTAPPVQQILNTHIHVEVGVITAPAQLTDCQGDPSCPAIVLCSVNVEPCLGTASDCITNGAASIRGTEETGSAKEVLNNNSDVSQTQVQETTPDIKEDEPCASVERKQPEGTDNPGLPSTEAEDDMMDRISHDLDYLLNRKSARNNTSVLTTPRKTSRPPAMSVHCQIKEEDEKEEEEESGDCTVSDNVTAT